MITDFGKELRKIRLDNNEVLRDMANHLGVSSSFLSAVEVGKKAVPDGWVNTLTTFYALDNRATTHLRALAADAVRNVKMDLCGASRLQRNAALVFSRDFGDLSDETAAQIIEYMSSDKRKG